ncbi:HAMP domain-containing histidine kinase [Paenibacillus doosanensis]|uniref:sensor histidine kinase n=1 Tax=Paenibacillus doosanensis TaxID=1229154 RepID=UPI00217FE9AD|nr:HAMP domain-containing sensor histidine kinase [Paenibacillus doosanensis]MCS7458890.1 HAMP domain-containing histidine kinase [Paenibacillus doosanensis]
MISTIKVKFLLGFFIIFAASLLLLNLLVVRIIETSNENIITEDLIGLKKNSSVYVKQTFMINHYSNDEIYFGQMAQEMVAELQHVSSSEVSAYSVKGELLYTSDASAFAAAGDEDLKQALDGKTAYTLHYSDSPAMVYYAYPVMMDGKKVGILRFAKDFSLLHEQSRHILDVIFYVTIAIFAAAFLFSYLLSRHITIPLGQLAKASTEVTEGNLGVRIRFRRKDEIGKLADNFNRMIEKITMQIGRIEQDRDRLEELNRHRKRFLDNVTHELKTPLTTILGYAEMIKDNGSGDEAFFDKGMNHIVGESRRLHEMVVKLLELSKETSVREPFEEVDAGRLVQDVCDGMAIKAERYKKTIACEAEAGLEVNGSPQKLRQLLINVIDNAIKYGYAHTGIDVKAARSGEDVRIVVANQGEDICSEELERWFEPFYRSDQRAFKEVGSCGLGLSISKAIADEHGGSIAVAGADGRTTVVIRLPRGISKEGGL